MGSGMGMETLISILFVMLMVTCSPARYLKQPIDDSAADIDYTAFTPEEQFYVSSWLTYYYQKGYYNMIQVRETDFGRCSGDHPIRNGSARASTSFLHLPKAQTFNSSCSPGRCREGMILIFQTDPIQPPKPLSSPQPAPSVKFNFATRRVAFLFRLGSFRAYFTYYHACCVRTETATATSF